MKMPYLAALVLLSSFGSAEAATWRELVRSDLGVSYLLPTNAQKQDLAAIRTKLLIKKGDKSYYRDRVVPKFRPIGNAAPTTVLGRMTLLPQPTARDTQIPSTGVPLSCGDVKASFDHARLILSDIDNTVDALEAVLNSVDISTATPAQLEALTQKVVQLADQMQALWAELQESFPISLSQEKYHLQYAWTYPFNQVCKDMSQRSITPEFTDLSMPGLIWSASSGQQLGDFLNIVQTPQYELSRVTFVKEVSLVSACLEDQSLEIQGTAQATTSSDCAFGGTSRFLLKAGTPNPMENPGAFTEKRLEALRCIDLLSDLRSWTSIAYQLSSLKLRAPKTYGGYMSGRLVWNNDHWTSRTSSTYSDRRDPAEPDQSFPMNKADDVSINLNPNGSVGVILHTWGDQPFTLQDVQCTNDPFASFISGWLIEDHGPSLLTLSLHPVTVKKLPFPLPTVPITKGVLQ